MYCKIAISNVLIEVSDHRNFIKRRQLKIKIKEIQAKTTDEKNVIF
jgi:hypothetical protein